MSTTALETPELPEEDNDPEALLKLRNAITVLVKEQNEAEAAARQAYNQVMQDRGQFIARCRAIAYEMLAEVYGAGFSNEDITRALGEGLNGIL